ncbi:uncharacterized protein AMSG_04859 [Thecamonas trahens ATCC 50062]|uniref:Uncharacterized protein n=1 Tax=Thecamonas trahens ATCC 50062 TaxID=461836 RepID=A0A0L0D850_THETB|nr:hypothetical protein AMSG_04859 [Thecamonas trahens ATCC 50062]KNC48410.1 hypothetical protein AMSG_04859 [Thecamonas trahens ATCC 50062]|eukprot:XP_013758527.1 hypothetical protein AMSG_04859 [Thecamonas trahens ATCC 50062]
METPQVVAPRPVKAIKPSPSLFAPEPPSVVFPAFRHVPGSHPHTTNTTAAATTTTTATATSGTPPRPRSSSTNQHVRLPHPAPPTAAHARPPPHMISPASRMPMALVPATVRNGAAHSSSSSSSTSTSSASPPNPLHSAPILPAPMYPMVPGHVGLASAQGHHQMGLATASPPPDLDQVMDGDTGPSSELARILRPTRASRTASVEDILALSREPGAPDLTYALPQRQPPPHASLVERPSSPHLPLPPAVPATAPSPSVAPAAQFARTLEAEPFHAVHTPPVRTCNPVAANSPFLRSPAVPLAAMHPLMVYASMASASMAAAGVAASQASTTCPASPAKGSRSRRKTKRKAGGRSARPKAKANAKAAKAKASKAKAKATKSKAKGLSRTPKASRSRPARAGVDPAAGSPAARARALLLAGGGPPPHLMVPTAPQAKPRTRAEWTRRRNRKLNVARIVASKLDRHRQQTPHFRPRARSLGDYPHDRAPVAVVGAAAN